MAPVNGTKEIERKARLFSLFGDPTRLRIVQLLDERAPISVSDIATAVGMSVACVSHHLQLLKDNDAVESSRDGTTIYYSLVRDPLIKKLISLI